MKIIFDKPFSFDGKEFKEIDVDLESLTGRDVSEVKRMWAQAGNFSTVVVTDVDFCAYLGAKAAKMPYEFVEALPAKDYCRLAQSVSNFLLV